MDAVAHFYCQPNSHPFHERHVSLNEPIKIGRSVARCRPAPNNAVFDCKVLSRNHALLWFENGKFYLQDTKSSNGTFVNNQRLSKASEESAAVEITSFDVVQFGVDVVDSMRKATHGCIVSQLRLYLPNGEESQQRNCAWNNQLKEKLPGNQDLSSIQSQDLYQLHHYLQEALYREQMLEQKLALLQRLLATSQESSEKGWQALINEDRLLSRLEFLENQLQACNKTQTEESIKSQLQQVQEEKYNYENTSKETLRQALQEKLEVVRKLSTLEHSLSNTEDECSHLHHIHERTQNELTSLAATHQAKVQEVEELTEKLQEVEQKYAESSSVLEIEKSDIERKFEALKEVEGELKKNLLLLEEENKNLKEKHVQETSDDLLVKEDADNDDLISADPEKLSIDEVLGAFDDIVDAEDSNDDTPEDQSATLKLSPEMFANQLQELKEKISQLEDEKHEEEEKRKQVESDFKAYQEEYKNQTDEELEPKSELQLDMEDQSKDEKKEESYLELPEQSKEESVALGQEKETFSLDAATANDDERFANGDASSAEKQSNEMEQKLLDELSNVRMQLVEKENKLSLLQDNLLEEQNSSLKYSSLAEELGKNCTNQSLTIDTLKNNEQETLNKLNAALERVAQKENQISSLEEKLRSCVEEKEKFVTKCACLEQSLTEIREEKAALAEELDKLKQVHLRNEESLKEQIESNQSLEDTFHKEQKKRESELSQKDEQIAEAIARCQQLIQERETNAKTKVAFTTAQKWIVIGILGAIFAFLYLLFF